MTHFNITTFTGSIQNQSVQLINARDLHKFLENGKQFSDWIQHRITKYGFTESLDFTVLHQLVNVDRGFFGMRQETLKEYHITLDMAKELCMLERSELGQQARRYFIEKEKQAAALAAQNAALLAKIPPFLLSNPDHTTAIIARAQQAFFTLHPECRELLRYREMGLTNAEIGKLTGLSRDSIRRRLSKMFVLGMVTRKSANQYTRLNAPAA